MPEIFEQVAAEMEGVSYQVLDSSIIAGRGGVVRQSGMEMAVIHHDANACRTRGVPDLS